jgi:hypothetical protein
MLKYILFAVFSVLIINTVTFAGNAVWWEGESAVKNDFVKSDWLDKTIKKTRLSKMKWLSCFVPTDDTSKKESYSAEYEIDVPADSEYNFWVREFYRRTGSPWKFRFDDGKWTEVKKNHPYKDISDLGRDRSLVWCNFGKFKLTKGKHKFELQIAERPGKGFQSGFDAFLLTNEPFTPEGWQKPKILAATEYIGTYIWLEGEDSDNNFINRGATVISKNQRLSKNKWLVCAASSGEDPADGFVAKWKFISPIGASFNVWIRELRKKQESPFLYRLNDGKWKKALPTMTAFDKVDLTKDSSVCWVNYKKSYIQEGKNTLEIKIDGENNKGKIKLAIDCILLSLEPYIPQGKIKPDTKIIPPKDSFVFRPQGDAFDKKNTAAFDLRKLNDSKTGIHGFLKVDEKGFVFTDGTRPRFWGVNVYDSLKMDNNSIELFVKQLAKFGVNLVRVKGTLCNPETKQFGDLDEKLLDRLFFFLAACRQNGIYVALANYNPLDYIITPRDGYKGYTKKETNVHPYGLLYINRKYRDVYKKWAKFLRRRNPYNKLRLYKDPTIAWFEIQSGQGILSDGLKNIPQAQKNILDKHFNAWLGKQHGDLPYALRSWSTAKKYHPVIKEDGRKGARCYRIFPFDSFQRSILENENFDHFNKRKMDQLRFITKLGNEINQELISYLRDECKFKGIVSIGSSSTAAPYILDGINAYLKSAGKIISGYAFVNPWRPKDINKVLKTDTFLEPKTILTNPFSSPVMRPVYKGNANVVSEVSWSFPNRCRGEAVPFISAYSSLHGNSTYLWYKADSHSWANRLGRNTVQSPATMGMFPGYALMFRRGDIKTGKTVVRQKLSIEDLYSLKGDSLYLKDFDKKKKVGKMPDSNGFINPFSFLVGKVECEFVLKGKSLKMETIKVKNFVNSKKGTVKSSTGELDLNYKYGQLKINTPKSQAFIGFTAKNNTCKLKDVNIKLTNRFGNVLVISLDNKPIANSGHILIQSFSEETNNDWITEKVPQKSYLRLVSVGDAPIVVKKINAKVSFRNIKKDGWKIWELDPNGYRSKEISPLANSKTKNLTLLLPKNTIYVELKKQ